MELKWKYKKPIYILDDPEGTPAFAGMTYRYLWLLGQTPSPLKAGRGEVIQVLLTNTDQF